MTLHGRAFVLDWSDQPPAAVVRLECTCGHTETIPAAFADYRRLYHEALCAGELVAEPKRTGDEDR